MRLTGEQYDALVKLMRGDSNSPSNRAARRVLIDGLTQAEARRELGLEKRSGVNNAVTRIEAADQLMRSVYQADHK